MAAGERTLTVKILGDYKAGAAFAKLERDGDGVAGKLGAVGAVIGKVFLASGVAATAFGTKAVLSASDLAETMSKVGVVFGDQQKIVTNFADQMAKDFGTPKREILDAASSIGLIGKASGLSQGDAAKMSTRLAKMAADASSFYNVPLPEALQAIQSGLVGEAEPMRRFGVLLNAQAVDAEAARLGLEKVGKEYTEGAKAQARASLITKGMTDASGDLERTQDSLANRLKEVRGRAENFAADVGTKLLPVVLEAFDLFQKWGGVLAEKVGPIVDTVKGGVMALFAAFKAGDGDVTSNGFAGAMERIGNIARRVVEWFKDNWPQIQETIADVFEWIRANVVPVVVAIADEVIRKVGEVIRWIQENWPQIREAIGHVVEAVKVIFTNLVDFLRPLWDNIKAIIDAAIRIIQGVIQTVMAIINGDWGKAWDGIKGMVSGVWDGIKAVVGGAIDLLKGIIGLGLEGVAAVWRQAWSGLKSGVTTVFDEVLKFCRELPGKIIDALGDVAGKFLEFGKMIVRKIIEGIKSLPGAIAEAIGGAIGGGTPVALPFPTVARRAHGGSLTGLGIVGEEGPELINVGSTPHYVTDAGRTAGLLGGGGTTIVYNQNTTVQGNVISERDLTDSQIRQFQEWVRRNGSMGL